MQHPDIPAGSPRAKILNVLITAEHVVELWKAQNTELGELSSALEDLTVAMSVIPDGWNKLVIEEIKDD